MSDQPPRPEDNLGEFVRRTARHKQEAIRKYKLPPNTSYAEAAKVYSTIADALPQAWRMSLDTRLNGLVRKTENIETADLLEQLPLATFPYDRLWLEGPSVFRDGVRLGALIETDQKNHAFTFRYVKEMFDHPGNLYNLAHARDLQLIIGDKVLDARPFIIRVSRNGIAYDEDHVIAYMDRLEANYRQKGRRIDATPLVNELYSIADYLARMFVLLNGKIVPSNFWDPDTERERGLRDLNRRRRQMGRPPLLPTTPITIDPIRIHPALLKPEGPATIQELFGKTTVRRSKYVTRPDGSLWLRKRDGQPWFRQEHERGIRGPVDRTRAPYRLTASKPDADLELHPDRPPTFHAPGNGRNEPRAG